MWLRVWRYQDENRPRADPLSIDTAIINTSLLAEFLAEAVPQLCIQTINNVYCGTPLSGVALFSSFASAIIILVGLYRYFYFTQRYGFKPKDVPLEIEYRESILWLPPSEYPGAWRKTKAREAAAARDADSYGDSDSDSDSGSGSDSESKEDEAEAARRNGNSDVDCEEIEVEVEVDEFGNETIIGTVQRDHPGQPRRPHELRLASQTRKSDWHRLRHQRHNKKLKGLGEASCVNVVGDLTDTVLSFGALSLLASGNGTPKPRKFGTKAFSSDKGSNSSSSSGSSSSGDSDADNFERGSESSDGSALGFFLDQFEDEEDVDEGLAKALEAVEDGWKQMGHQPSKRVAERLEQLKSKMGNEQVYDEDEEDNGKEKEQLAEATLVVMDNEYATRAAADASLASNYKSQLAALNRELSAVTAMDPSAFEGGEQEKWAEAKRIRQLLEEKRETLNLLASRISEEFEQENSSED